MIKVSLQMGDRVHGATLGMGLGGLNRARVRCARAMQDVYYWTPDGERFLSRQALEKFKAGETGIIVFVNDELYKKLVAAAGASVGATAPCRRWPYPVGSTHLPQHGIARMCRTLQLCVITADRHGSDAASIPRDAAQSRTLWRPYFDEYMKARPWLKTRVQEGYCDEIDHGTGEEGRSSDRSRAIAGAGADATKAVSGAKRLPSERPEASASTSSATLAMPAKRGCFRSTAPSAHQRLSVHVTASASGPAPPAVDAAPASGSTSVDRDAVDGDAAVAVNSKPFWGTSEEAAAASCAAGAASTDGEASICSSAASSSSACAGSASSHAQPTRGDADAPLLLHWQGSTPAIGLQYCGFVGADLRATM